ncbi:hypothetical protein PoB_005578400 [Plakobranchus ocellatus]|uniref:Uncharacterized protein n=1 Tax=Plakobranchus ocellatus TaxID=259542 RepID=A0AAV4CEV9_9GAST|nr:hypothetical protein PoB_005578400 [Plakobranchus ocellatus]
MLLRTFVTSPSSKTSTEEDSWLAIKQRTGKLHWCQMICRSVHIHLRGRPCVMDEEEEEEEEEVEENEEEEEKVEEEIGVAIEAAEAEARREEREE